MAGIDKTYTNSYEDYRKFKDWADTQNVEFFDGSRECVGNWVWSLTKEDFDNGEIPIMNTPTWIDIYLIQNCKIEFVIERLQDVYGEESYAEYKTVNLTANPPEEFAKNRKITITNNKRTKYPLHSKPYGGKSKWWIQCDGYFWYNDETKTWVHNESYYPANTNTAHISSIKGIIRHLRKQYLPKGITFSLIGRYEGEEYSIVVC